MKLLKRLCEAPGIPGREEEVRRIIEGEMRDYVSAFRTDYLGNLIAHRPGKGPVVAIAAHMDEIGFIVRSVIKETGFLRLYPLGLFDPKTLVSQRVVVHTKQEKLVGCIGSTPVHILKEEERKKPLELKDLFVDLGLPKEEVMHRVTVGDMVTLKQDFLTYGDVVSGKAIDDRSGLYIGIEAIKRANKIACDLFLIGTAQEEVGWRGARVAGSVHPQISIALDVTFAADVPGVSEEEKITRLGHGVGIKLVDSTVISHPVLIRTMRKLAEDNGIAYQEELVPHGGTDAGELQAAGEGAAAIALSLPTRYVHSVVETAHRKDIEAEIELLIAFLETADQITLDA